MLFQGHVTEEDSQSTVETLNKVSFLHRQCPNTIVNWIVQNYITVNLIVQTVTLDLS